MLQLSEKPECPEMSELFFNIDLIVLVKNKARRLEYPGWVLEFDCIASSLIFKPLVVELRYFFHDSKKPALIKANKRLQIGSFYRIKSSAEIWEDSQGPITLYDPEYEHIKTNVLPRQFVTLLVNHVTKDDLWFEYCGDGDDCMKLQYKREVLFP